MAKKKHKQSNNSKQSYENMRGSPMDVADHPARMIPDPQGGLHNGTGISNLMAGSPNPDDYGV